MRELRSANRSGLQSRGNLRCGMLRETVGRAVTAAAIAILTSGSTLLAQDAEGSHAVAIGGGRQGPAGWYDLMNQGSTFNVGLRLIAQQSAPRSAAFAAMGILGGIPSTSARWLRVDVGVGFAGQSGSRQRWYNYFGPGVIASATAGALRSRRVQPELTAWTMAATSVALTGVSLGLRVMERTPPKPVLSPER